MILEYFSNLIGWSSLGRSSNLLLVFSMQLHALQTSTENEIRSKLNLIQLRARIPDQKKMQQEKVQVGF